MASPPTNPNVAFVTSFAGVFASWTGLGKLSLVYDSLTMPLTNTAFLEAVLHKPNLAFVTVLENGSVCGAFVA